MPDLRFTRNIGTLTSEQQDAICATRIGIAGCGLGSETARQLIKFGFDISALADPDTVESHNLNRQHFHHHHVGRSKADSLLDALRLTRPELSPQIFPEGITAENYREFVSASDIVIDAIDPTAIHLSIAVTREAHAQGKSVVTALDFGFGARLFVFPADGIGIMEFLGLGPDMSDEDILKLPITEVLASYMQDVPRYSLEVLDKLMRGEIDYYPQNMLAVATAALLITGACKRLVLGQSLPVAPAYLHTDIDLQMASF